MQSTIDAELPEGVELRDLNDYRTLRGSIFGGVQKAFQTAFPISYGGTRMEVDNVRYDDEKDYTLAEQKKAILEDKYLTRKLKGTVRLYDEESGEMLDERDMPLMRVPWLTERNTFIHNGSEYATIMQSRLLPGVYTRRQNNGHLETQFNARPGAGKGFRIGFEPDTAQYRLRIAQANLHMYSLLKDLGIPDEELRGRWGDEVFEANKRKYDARVFDKAYQRLVPKQIKESRCFAGGKSTSYKRSPG
jgi:DNA-directed RNA polymerase beta subunit